MKTQNTQFKGFKYLIWLIALFFTSYAATLILQNRVIAVGNLFVCAAIFAYPLSYTIADVITEVYGYNISRQLIWSGIVSWIIIASLVEISIHMPIPPFWMQYDKAYDFVMAPVFRGVLLGVASVVIGQFINIYMMTKLKIKTKGKYFILRSIASTAVGDFITVVLALFGVFSGRMPATNITGIIFYEYIFMIIYAIVMSIPAAMIAAHLKKLENIEVYDFSTNFNPFKFK